MAQYDLIILNGDVVDGSGGDPIRADIAIRDGKIAEVGSLDRNVSANRILDVSGLVVAPGFIDIHTHAERKLLSYSNAWNFISQGVTTVIGGNCGGSPLPIDDFFSKADSVGIAVNIALFVGQNTIRRKVMGRENRAPSNEELAEMKSIVQEAMEDGAMGLSTGLKYIPGAYSNIAEIIELVKIVAKYDGIYATHMRDEGLGLIEAIQEALTIGSTANVPVEISHYKAVGKSMWGSSKRILAMIDSARTSGQDVNYDQYPYTATSTGLGILIPDWALEGGRSEFTKRWEDPDIRAKVKSGIIHNLLYDRGGGDPASVVIVESEYDSNLVGKTLSQITEQYFNEISWDNVAETVLRLMEAGRHICIYHSLHEDDVRRILKHPYGLVGSDAHTVSVEEKLPHPRNYGTFPRVLGHYVRELHLLSLQQAIYKMSGAPADRLQFTDRGKIIEGNWADIVIFDPKTIKDEATWEESKKIATGIHYVLVNGEIVLDNGKPTGKRPGKILRRKREM